MKNLIRPFLIGCLALLLVVPFVANDYILSVLILTLYSAFLGQAWNLMMGFAGQLSLGHSLYVGIGAYVGAGFFVHFGLSPWLGMILAVLIASSVAVFIAFLGFRFAIKGVHFSLLTIAFAECGRILFDHWDWFGGSAGLFLPITSAIDLINLRAAPYVFYYIFLMLTILGFFFCRYLMQTRLGYAWLALREDQDAAASLGVNLLKTKILAVALSAGMTALGGTIYGFYQNALFPDQVFAMAKSIEILMGPIVGGVGTLMGPIVGAIILTPLGDFFSHLTASFELPGLKHLFYGMAMLAIMLFVPSGIWPKIKERYIIFKESNVI